MPLNPEELAAARAAFHEALHGELAAGVTSAKTAEREELTVCALALATLISRYPGLGVRVEPARSRPFIGMIDVVLTPPAPATETLVRVIVNAELARGAWREAVDAIVDSVCRASPPITPHTRGKKPA